MNAEQIGKYLDGQIVNFRGDRWRPHFVFPQNYLAHLVGQMEENLKATEVLDVRNVQWSAKLRQYQVRMRTFLDKAKRVRYFDHIDLMLFMNGFYKELRGFNQILWKLRLKQEI